MQYIITSRVIKKEIDFQSHGVRVTYHYSFKLQDTGPSSKVMAAHYVKAEQCYQRTNDGYRQCDTIWIDAGPTPIGKEGRNTQPVANSTSASSGNEDEDDGASDSPYTVANKRA